MTDAAIERLTALAKALRDRDVDRFTMPAALAERTTADLRTLLERVKALEGALTEANEAANVILARITAEIGQVIAAATDEDAVPLMSEYGVEITAKQLRRLYDATDGAALNPTGEPT